MPKKTEECCACSPRCMGLKLLVLGVLIVLNTMYSWVSWGLFVGGIVGLAGLLKLVTPKCVCQR